MTTQQSVKAPWLSHFGKIPATLDYYQGTMFEAVRDYAGTAPKQTALRFMGTKESYKSLVGSITECAKALYALGIRENDRVTIALPNCPQAVYMLYALNRLGAVASMVHPLSAEKELEYFINDSESKAILTLDLFYPKIEAIRKSICAETVIVTGMEDVLTFPVSVGYRIASHGKIPKIPSDAPVLRWKDFLQKGRDASLPPSGFSGEHPAVVLYSGGTTGVSKGISLTNLNMNAFSQQLRSANPDLQSGDSILAAMPVFHGFGLGVCIHASLMHGGMSVLVPRFTPKTYGKLVLKYKCSVIAGVPTLFEAMLNHPAMRKADLSFLKGVYCGGDSLPGDLKTRLDDFLREHGSPVPVREGYGTTETVTACCLTPPHEYKPGSIGIPLPDTYFKIVRPDTDEELPYGEEGEILIAGPSVMKEYINHPEETAKTLRRHADGMTWVYTGDLGRMDEDGFVYFRGRIKRMIVTSGYNVYPARMEDVIDQCPLVCMSCVIGVPDPYRMQKVKAFVTTMPGVSHSEETKREILDFLKHRIAVYEMPRELEFRDELPKTLVGKVAYRVLEEEERAKREANG